MAFEYITVASKFTISTDYKHQWLNRNPMRLLYCVPKQTSPLLAVQSGHSGASIIAFWLIRPSSVTKQNVLQMINILALLTK